MQKLVGVIYCWRTPGMPPEMMTRMMSSGDWTWNPRPSVSKKCQCTYDDEGNSVYTKEM